MPIESIKNEVVNAAFIATVTAGVGNSLSPIDGLCDPHTGVCGNFGGTAGVYIHSRSGIGDQLSLVTAGYGTNDVLSATYNPVFLLGTFIISAGPYAGLAMHPKKIADGSLNPDEAIDMTVGARAFALVTAGGGGRGVVITVEGGLSNLAHTIAGSQSPLWSASVGIAMMFPSDLR